MEQKDVAATKTTGQPVTPWRQTVNPLSDRKLAAKACYRHALLRTNCPIRRSPPYSIKLLVFKHLRIKRDWTSTCFKSDTDDQNRAKASSRKERFIMLVPTSDANRFRTLIEGLPAAVPADQRRTGKRLVKYRARGLRAEVRDRFVPPVFRGAGWQAPSPGVVPFQLYDVSDSGLGAVSNVAVAVGSVLVVSGELHSVDSCLEFDVSCTVAHCLCQEDGSFRVGFAFLEEVRYQQLSCDHQQAFTLDLDQ